MSDNFPDLRGVLIQVSGGRLMLPNACIAEILSVADPEPIEGAPDWLLGRIRWRGWQVPLISFATMAGLGEHDPALRGQRVLVLKTLGGDARLPYFALLTQGFPRLVTVSQAMLAEEPDAELGNGVAAAIRYQDEEALVPDMDVIEQRLQAALAA